MKTQANHSTQPTKKVITAAVAAATQFGSILLAEAVRGSRECSGKRASGPEEKTAMAGRGRRLTAVRRVGGDVGTYQTCQ